MRITHSGWRCWPGCSRPNDLDRARVVELGLLHDLAESSVGDITPYDRTTLQNLDPDTRRNWLNQRHIRTGEQRAAKQAAEDAAIDELSRSLPESRRALLWDRWSELRERQRQRQDSSRRWTSSKPGCNCAVTPSSIPTRRWSRSIWKRGSSLVKPSTASWRRQTGRSTHCGCLGRVDARGCGVGRLYPAIAPSVKEAVPLIEGRPLFLNRYAAARVCRGVSLSRHPG